MKCAHRILIAAMLVLTVLVQDGPGALVFAGTIDDAATAQLFEQGKHDFTEGRYDLARQRFEQVLSVSPSNESAKAYLRLVDELRDRAIAEAIALAETSQRILRSQVAKSPSRPLPAASVQESAVQEQPPVEEPAEEERGPALAVAKTPVKRVGTVGLFINDEEVSLDHPIVVREGAALVPLRDLSANLYVTLIELQPGAFRLMFPDGGTKDIPVALVDGEPALPEREISEIFGVEAHYEEPKQAFTIKNKSTSFQTYAVAKSEEELKQEAAEEAVATRTTRSLLDEDSREVPDAAKPSVDLKGTVAYSYRNLHPGSPDRTAVTTVRGQAYGFDVNVEDNRRDIIRGTRNIFDHDYTRVNLSKPDLYLGFFDQTMDLYPLRGQSERFNGAKIRKTWDQRSATSLLWGETENSASGNTRLVKYLGQLYEARQEFAPIDRLRLKNSLMYVQNEADLPELAATTAMPRSNVVNFHEAELRLPWDVTLLGDAARSHYEPDNDSDNHVVDWDWRVSSTLKKQRYNLGYTYEFVGDRYASVGNPAIYQDYRGWNVYGGARPTDWWSVYGSLLRYGNNVDNDPNIVFQDNQAISLSSSFQLPHEHNLNLSFGDFLSDPTGNEPGSSSRSKLYRADYILPFIYDTHLLTNYQLTLVRQPAGIDSNGHGFGASLFKGFEHGSSIYLSQQFTKTLFDEQQDTFVSTTSLTLNYQATPTLSFYLNPAYNRDMAEARKGVDTLSGGVGLRAQLQPQTTLTSEYRVDTYNADTEHGWPKTWSWFVFVSQEFGFKTAPAFGAVDGQVINDINANGKADIGEPGLPDVLLRLDGRREMVTGADGRYHFARVVPGTRVVSVDPSSLPPEYTLIVGEQKVPIKRNKQVTLNFLAVEAANITGRVFVDVNENGVYDPSEEPIESVAVVLNPGDQFRRTNEEGVFRFDEVMPGQYTLNVYPQDIPVGYELANKEALAVALKPGQVLKGVAFPLRLLVEPKPN